MLWKQSSSQIWLTDLGFFHCYHSYALVVYVISTKSAKTDYCNNPLCYLTNKTNTRSLSDLMLYWLKLFLSLFWSVHASSSNVCMIEISKHSSFWCVSTFNTSHPHTSTCPDSGGTSPHMALPSRRPNSSWRERAAGWWRGRRPCRPTPLREERPKRRWETLSR